MRRRPWWLALAVAVGVAACSAGGEGRAAPSTTTEPATTTTVARVAGTDGCGNEPPPVGGGRLVHATLESSGGTRAYMVYVPESYDPAVPAPVAYVFHGATSNKEQQLAYSAFPPHAEADGALLVLPDALGTPTRWSPLGPAIAGVEGVNDLELFDALHAAVGDAYCVDPERVLVTGCRAEGSWLPQWPARGPTS